MTPPRHLVLSLSRGEARLFEGYDQLSPVPSALFPMRAERPARRSASRPSLAAADTVSFLREVGVALGTYRRLHPGPVVVVGEDRLVSEFERVSGNLERCAGTLRVNAATEPLPRIAERCRPLLEAYLLSRQDEALALLERRIWADRAVVGLAAAWH